MNSGLNVCNGLCLGRILPGTDLQLSPSPVSQVLGMEMFLWKQTFQPQEMSLKLHLTSAAITRTWQKKRKRSFFQYLFLFCSFVFPGEYVSTVFKENLQAGKAAWSQPLASY